MDKRESFFWDVLKGTAIFLMLWGHCIQFCSLGEVVWMKDIVFKTIYSFHMPVFMLVSGYLFYASFQKRSLTTLLEHRIRGMLHPIIMATFLNNILMLLPEYILSDRVSFLYGRLFSGIESDLWFLWTVLYCSVVTAVCCKCTDQPLLRLVMTVLGGLTILLVPQWNMTLFMYPYFVVGFFCGMYREQARRFFKWIRYVALIAFPIMLAFYESKHYIYVTPMISEELSLSATMEIACFRWAIGFVGSVWLMAIMEMLLGLGERLSPVRRCLQAVSHLGRNSLQIYCLSASLLSGYLPHLYRKFAELAGGNIFAENAFVYDCLVTPALAGIWSVILYGVVLLLKKWKLHKLFFGR